MVHHFVPNSVRELSVRSKTMFLSARLNMGLSPFAVHYIVKRFRESGEILVSNGQMQKPLLNASDHLALRRYCLRNSHATMMDVATWAWEYFGKLSSLNTVRHLIKKCNLKLYYAKRKAFIHFVLKHRRVLWTRSHLRRTEKQ